MPESPLALQVDRDDARPVSSYPAFLALVAAGLLVPGPDTLVVLRVAAGGGARAGVWAAAGSGAGNLLWGTASLAGLTAVLAASPALLHALKLAGAGYLLWLGVRMVRAEGVPGAVPQDGDSPAGRAFLSGLLSDLSNVKVGLFWVALAPQFLRDDAGVLPMAAMVATMGGLAFAWLALWATAAARTARGLAPGPRVNACAGVLFCALAAELLLTA